MTTPKIIRTRRAWTEPCRDCGGTGQVHKRQHFALWTPDEYAKAMGPWYPLTLDAKHDVPEDAYVCTAIGGCSIFEACREGVELAVLVGRPVVFEFNGAVAICRHDEDPAKVAKRWWKLAYGKTYEQSMRER